MSRIVYLACPYTHPLTNVREERFRVATKSAAALIRQGHIVFSPITMTHPIDVELAGDSGTLGSDYWVSFDEAFMSFCSEMAIVRMAGWDTSAGVARERAHFEARSLPIWFLDPETGVRLEGE